MQCLLQKGADANARNNMDETPLHYAVKYGSSSEIQYLLFNGADKNAMNKNQETPLQYALDRGDSGLISIITDLVGYEDDYY